MHTGGVSLFMARVPVIQGYKDKFQSPIDWNVLDPRIAQIDALMISAQSRHPNAARLFVNLLYRGRGRALLAGVQLIPVRRDMEAHTKRALRSHMWFVEPRISMSMFKKRSDCFGRYLGPLIAR